MDASSSAPKGADVVFAEAKRQAIDQSSRQLAPLAASGVENLKKGEASTEEAGETFGCNLLWPAIGFVCMLVSFGIVAIAVSQLLHPHGRKSTPTAIYGVIGMFSVGGLVAAYVCYRLLGQKYQVFSDHLIAWQCFKPTTLRWDQIREVFQNMHPGWINYRVVVSGRRAFTLRGETRHHKCLGDLITERVAARLLPAALEELEAGARFALVRSASAPAVSRSMVNSSRGTASGR